MEVDLNGVGDVIQTNENPLPFSFYLLLCSPNSSSREEEEEKGNGFSFV